MTACLFGLLAWRVGVRPELLAYSALAAVGVPLAAIDVLEQRLPAKLLMPAFPIVAALLALAALMEHNGATMLRSLAAMTVLLAFYLTIALAAPDALGAADIRLAGLLGLALGWPGWTTAIVGTLLGLLYGSLTGATMIALRRATHHTPIPLGSVDELAGWVGSTLVSPRPLSRPCLSGPEWDRPVSLARAGRRWGACREFGGEQGQ